MRSKIYRHISGSAFMLTKFGKKAISPILATLLIIILVVAAAVLAYAFSMGYLGSLTGQVERMPMIDNVQFIGNQIKITVRNRGTSDMVIDVVYIDGTAYKVEQLVKAGESKVITLNFVWKTSEKYKIKVVETGGLSYESEYTAPSVKPSWALRFDGIDDYVEIPEILPDEGTMEFWFKPSWNGDDGVGHTLFDASYGSKYFFLDKDSNNNLRWFLEDASDRDMQLVVDGTFFKQEEWYHITVTWKYESSGPHEIYVNGEKLGSRTYSLGNKPTLYSNPRIGFYTVDYLASKRGADGVIDEFRIYNKTLSQDEIKQNIQGNILIENLVVWFAFDEGQGGTVSDQSQNGNDGTLMPSYPDNCPAWVEGYTP